MVYDCGIYWSFSLVSLDDARILIINLPVFLLIFLLLPQVGLRSMTVVFPGRAHLFLSMMPIFQILISLFSCVFFLLLLYVGLRSMIVAFTGRSHLFLSMMPVF